VEDKYLILLLFDIKVERNWRFFAKKRECWYISIFKALYNRKNRNGGMLKFHRFFSFKIFLKK
jgi:hypothetical protein